MRLDDLDTQYNLEITMRLQAAQAAGQAWTNYVMLKYGVHSGSRIMLDGSIIDPTGPSNGP